MRVHLGSSLLAALTCACSASTEPPTTAAKTYAGQYSTSVVETTVSTSLTGGGTFSCTNTYTMSGTISMTLDVASGAAVGTATIAGTQAETAFSGGATCLAKGSLATSWSPAVSGSPSALLFNGENVATNGGYVVTTRTSFRGAIVNEVVSGTLGFSVSGAGTIGTTSITQSYSTTTAVTLR